MAIFRRSPDIAPCGFTGTHHFAFAALVLVCVWCSTIALLHAYQVSRSRAYSCNPQGSTVASNGAGTEFGLLQAAHSGIASTPQEPNGSSVRTHCRERCGIVDS